MGDARREAPQRFHACAVLGGNTQRLAVGAVDEDSNDAAAGTLAVHTQIAAKQLRHSVEASQLGFDDAARARQVAPRFPRGSIDHVIDDAAGGAGITHAEEAPHPCVRSNDAAVGRNDDRRDDGARFEKAEIEVGGRPLGIPPTRWLRHQIASGNTVGVRPRLSASKG